ncbi:MAG: hypothetical protein ABEJ31_15420 [Haloarculaceae archaeon]
MDGSDRDAIGEREDALETRSLVGSGRGPLARFVRWLLLDAHRWLVAGLISASIFVVTLLLWRFGPVPQRRLVEGSITTGAFSNGFASLQEVTADVVVLVLAINQLVLSPELGSVKKHRERFNEVMEYRRDVGRRVDVQIAPSRPSFFLRALLDTVGDRASAVQESVRSSEDADLRRRVEELVDAVEYESDQVREKLARRDFEDIGMYRAAWDFETEIQIAELRRLRRRYDDVLTEAQADVIEDFLVDLKLFDTGREYLTTVYVQSEFINFSRALLVTGLLALVTASYGSQLFRPAVFPGSTLGLRNVFWVVSAAYTVALFPFALLVSYVARLVSITKRTLFIGPFVPPSDQRRQSVVEDAQR